MTNQSTILAGVHVLATGLFITAFGAFGQPGTPAKAVPPAQSAPGADVPKDWLTAVQKDIAQSEYNVTWQEQAVASGMGAAWQAPNRAQDLRTYFTIEGPRVVRRAAAAGSWTWGLELVGFGGTGGASAPSVVRDVCAEGNRITFERDGLSEWYVNSASGLEQGFTIHQSPDPGSDLVVRMAVRGDLSADMMPDGRTVEFLSAGGVGVMRYGKLRVADALGKALPAAMTLDNGNIIELRVDAQGAAFPLTIDPLATSASWTAESDQASAYFGCSVATAGDVNGDGYSDVIVGAPGFDNGQTNEGRAFVYYGSASGLSASAGWTAESNQDNASLGTAVSTAGDVNGDGYADVIIGAPYYSNGQSSEGRAYVYYGSASGLSATAGWTAESDQASASFGSAVSTAGDVNGDGYSDVIVGAKGYSNGQSSEGRAYVYYGSASGLSATAGWTAESDQGSASFGSAVSTAGDVNGDGYADVIVGAPNYSNGQTTEGRAFVYYGSASGLSATAGWTAESDQANARFGSAVSTVGDVNGDGYADVIVGASYYTNDLTRQGRVYAYYGSASGLPDAASWTAAGDQANAYFGNSVSTAGDVNGDGYADVIIGAYYYNNNLSQAGRALVYYGSASGLSATPNWTAEGDQAGANFGFAVSTAGDVNGDGYSDVIVGAVYYSNGQSNEGRAYVYYGSPSTLSATADWSAASDTRDAAFGSSVAAAGDVNGDGYADVIVGAPGYSTSLQQAGRVFVYYGSAAGLSATADWTADGARAYAGFGSSVSTAGDVNGDGYADVIIGAYGDGNGRVYGYHGSAAGLCATPNWMVESDQPSAYFGASVAAAGDVNGDGYGDVIIGAYGYGPNQDYEGRAFVYHGSPSGLSATPNWTAGSGQSQAEFGISVSTAGDVNGDGYADVIIGAYNYSNGQGAVGRAYVYHGSASGLSGTANWIANGGQSGAEFGNSVSTAGDVNGDGYSDVVVGEAFYNNAQGAVGRANVYYGSASGLSVTPNWTADGDQIGATFANSVSTAGDVNGDGYSDIIIGAPYHDASQVDAGRACVYCGSALGLPATANWIAESDQGGALLGYSVAAAGDVNGDGYGDVIVGAYFYYNGLVHQGGAAFEYYGNGEAGRGLSLKPRQRRGDGTAILSPMGVTPGASVRLAVQGRTPFGRTKAKLECEVKPFHTPFDGTGTVKTASWTSTGIGGAAFDQAISGLTPGAIYHWRARLLYNPATTPFQQKSRWFTVPTNGAQEGDFRVYAPPITGSIIINNNHTATNTTAATLALTWAGGAGTGVTKMRFSNDGSTWSAWETPVATRAYTLPGGDGYKTIRVQYLDKLNYKSPVFSDYIRLDTVPPVGSIIINSGTAATTSVHVTLTLIWADTGAGVTRMRFSDNGSTWTAWASQKATRAYTLPAGLGYHTVRVQFSDAAQNYSPVYNDYIKLVAP